jgi:REP element-mobilizing transposase RayT
MRKQDQHVQFFTAVCKDWLPLLASDIAKSIIIDALKFREKNLSIKVCTFVIMPNHMHLIWRISEDLRREDFQRDFMKITARQLLNYLHATNDRLYDQLEVDAADRKLQVWKRDSLSVDLYTAKFFKQKLDYIHNNPCQPKWELAAHPADYKFSSALFYESGIDAFDLLTHYIDV